MKQIRPLLRPERLRLTSMTSQVVTAIAAEDPARRPRSIKPAPIRQPRPAALGVRDWSPAEPDA